MLWAGADAAWQGSAGAAGYGLAVHLGKGTHKGIPVANWLQTTVDRAWDVAFKLPADKSVSTVWSRQAPWILQACFPICELGMMCLSNTASWAY